ncbi:MAG: hypothetical protein ACE10B_09225 [Phycisphaerales bacterium]
MADIHRLVRFVALTTAVVWFGLTVRAQAGQPAEPAGAGETESAARIIDGPANMRSEERRAGTLRRHHLSAALLAVRAGNIVAASQSAAMSLSLRV